ncbi:MAG: hisS [Dehalococcoidia bacterium]|nr:hisS [Dehalococcoidia bacterium]MBF8304730.1 hisS [Dehalococcoidia bacterium]
MFKAPRGTFDILPSEQQYWRYIENKAIHLCNIYGYKRIDTPVFEEGGLFTRTIGQGTDIVEKETYTFEDRGKSLMTLRPEGTAPVCRAYIEHGMHTLPQPVKLYYFSSIFRYERPQSGRYREHHQFGYEAIGESDPALDAEVIDMAWQLYSSLGINGLSLQLNSIGCRECRPKYLELLKKYYSGQLSSVCNDCKIRYEKNPLRLLDCKQASCQPISGAAPRNSDYLCADCASHFASLQKYLGILEIPFNINHRLVRGLDYYTRTVFEVQPKEEGAQSTIGGGGRYDGLIGELGGQPTPAVGLATGIERIVLNLKRQNVAVPPVPQPQVFVAFVGEAARLKSKEIVTQLRRAGVSTEQALGNKSLKAQFRHANALGAKFTLLLGDDELRQGIAILRDMSTSEQRPVPQDKLVSEINRL